MLLSSLENPFMQYSYHTESLLSMSIYKAVSGVFVFHFCIRNYHKSSAL